MQLHLRHRRSVDVNGRIYFTTDEMAEIYGYFHSKLNETYWHTVANHKICADAMELLKTTHISKKNISFLMIFASITSEVYSHAHYNVQQLPYHNRSSARRRYWAQILSLYKVVTTKADKDHSYAKCYQSMALLLHFATLYSLYKDIADEDFIVSLHQQAENYAFCDHYNRSQLEAQQVREYYESIETIYRLRCERQRTKEETVSSELEDAATLNIAEEGLAESVVILAPSFGIPMSKDDLYRIDDEAFAKRRTMMLKKQRIDEEEMLEELSEPAGIDILKKEIKSVRDEHDLLTRKISGHFSHPTRTETELEQAIKCLNSSMPNRNHSSEPAQLKVNEMVKEKRFKEDSVLTNSTHSIERRAAISCCLPLVEIAEKHQKILASFDFREEFERRFHSEMIWALTVMKLPVIGRPRKIDVVQSYRRKGLFDNVEYRKPILMHEISLHNVDNTDVTVVSEVETEKLRVKEVSLVEESTDEPNNNTLTTDSYVIEKITNAGLLEKSVSSTSPCLNRRSSMIT